MCSVQNINCPHFVLQLLGGSIYHLGGQFWNVVHDWNITKWSAQKYPYYYVEFSYQAAEKQQTPADVLLTWVSFPPCWKTQWCLWAVQVSWCFLVLDFCTEFGAVFSHFDSNCTVVILAQIDVKMYLKYCKDTFIVEQKIVCLYLDSVCIYKRAIKWKIEIRVLLVVWWADIWTWQNN